jgi:hypothetical protein
LKNPPYICSIKINKAMAATREKMMELLKAKYPAMFLRTTEEFDGSKGGIWTSGEDGLPAKDGFNLFNYYGEGKRYELGVHTEIGTFLEKHGWFAEWYDCGTVMLWIN